MAEDSNTQVSLRRGATIILVFGGMMDADFYVSEIIQKTVVHSLRESLPMVLMAIGMLIKLLL